MHACMLAQMHIYGRMGRWIDGWINGQIDGCLKHDSDRKRRDILAVKPSDFLVYTSDIYQLVQIVAVRLPIVDYSAGLGSHNIGRFTCTSAGETAQTLDSTPASEEARISWD